jgi:transcriptional regulator with XRE-family HTH domain
VSTSFAKSFGRAIAAERRFLGLTQTQLGERLGWSASNISAIESGERAVAVALLPEVCEALECGVLQLLERAQARDRRAMRI